MGLFDSLTRHDKGNRQDRHLSFHQQLTRLSGRVMFLSPVWGNVKGKSSKAGSVSSGSHTLAPSVSRRGIGLSPNQSFGELFPRKTRLSA